MHALQGERKMRVLVVNTGTFCDGTLIESVLTALRGHEVVYLTDENIQPRDRSLVQHVHTYSTPSFILHDPGLGPADPYQSPVTWAITHPMQARQVMTWVNDVGERLARLERRYRPDCVLLHFAMLSAVMSAERSPLSSGILTARPHVLLYFTPGVPNATIPWLFDSRLRSPQFRLYSRATQPAVLSSWRTTLQRLAMSTGLFGDAVGDEQRTACALRTMHHALCWDREILEPLRAAVPGMTARWVGALSTRAHTGQAHTGRVHTGRAHTGRAYAGRAHTGREGDALPRPVRAFLTENRRRDRGVAFVSFGSFGHVASLRSIVPLLARELSRRLGHATLFHDTLPARTDADEDADAGVSVGADAEFAGLAEDGPFLVHRGFVPYEALLPEVALVAFTGSLCLQMSCYRYAVPMLYVPVLTEQYFWAKNYQHFTRVRYVDVEGGGSPEAAVASAVGSAARQAEARVRPFLRRVRSSLGRNDGAARLVALIEEAVAQHEARLRDSALPP